MAKIATCPQCIKQLSLPSPANLTDVLECPECQATFSLSTAVQIALPEARIITPVEPTPTADIPTLLSEQPINEAAQDNTPLEPATTPTLQSWEERLKKALATNESVAETTALDEGVEQQEEQLPLPKKPTPNFEFELDLPPKGEHRQPAFDLDLQDSPLGKNEITDDSNDADSTSPSVKTLADFAADITVPVENEQLSATHTSDFEDTAPVEESMEEATVEKQPEPSLEPQLIRRPMPKRGFPKVAAFVVGPVLGSLVGLYSLLWFQGTKADYFGLAQVLPNAITPAKHDELDNSNIPATEQIQHSQQQVAATQPPPTDVKHDNAVMPASSVEPVSLIRSETTLSALEFSKLVDEANAALTDITTGDLIDRASVRKKGHAYVVLCRLAKEISLADQLGLAPLIQEKAKLAHQIFQQLAANQSAHGDLSHISSRWWDYQERPNNGIFLLGQVLKLQQLDEHTLGWIQLSDQPNTPTIPILLNRSGYQAGDHLGIVGRVLSAADEFPIGFSGQQLVKADYCFLRQAAQ